MKKALIIDDEPEVAEILRLVLQCLEYDAEAFVDLDKVTETSGYDIVFCDFTLINCSGIDTYKKLKGINPHLASKFILITGAELDDSTLQYVKQEGIYIVKKPYKIQDIKEVLQTLDKTL